MNESSLHFNNLTEAFDFLVSDLESAGVFDIRDFRSMPIDEQGYDNTEYAIRQAGSASPSHELRVLVAGRPMMVGCNYYQ